MTAERETHFVDATLAEVVADRRPHTASDWPPVEHVFEVVSGELRPLVYQVAEMTEHEPHQLVAAAEYLHGLLEREPLRSSPTWEAQRVVLGLFLMGLTSSLAATEVITADERKALHPAYHRDAVAQVTAAFDPTYVPEPMEPPEEAVTTSDQSPAPEMTDDDLLALL